MISVVNSKTSEKINFPILFIPSFSIYIYIVWTVSVPIVSGFINHNFTSTNFDLFDSLCLMPADLRITVFGSCAFFKIHRLEDGVLSVLLLDGESRLLNFSFTLPGGIFGFPLFLFGGIVGEEVKLESTVIFLRCVRFRQDMICYNIHTADKQILVHDPVEEF